MFWEKFEILCRQQGKSPNGFVEEIGLSSGICTKWKNGSTPKGDVIVKIADALDCSIDYLLERTGNPQSHKSSVSFGDLSNNSGIVGNVGSTINASVLDKQASTLLEAFEQLDEVSKAKAIVYVDELRGK